MEKMTTWLLIGSMIIGVIFVDLYFDSQQPKAKRKPKKKQAAAKQPAPNRQNKQRSKTPDLNNMPNGEYIVRGGKVFQKQ